MSGDTKWVRVTKCENIPLREGRCVTIDTHEIAIFNLGDRFLAIDSRCPHKGGPLSEGIVSGTTVVCPLHAWKVDLQTGSVVNQANAVPCVTTYPTRVDDGVIHVELQVERSVKQGTSTTCVTGLETKDKPFSTGQFSTGPLSA
jgi:nitrite reductase (NADH) small subunit